MLATQQARTLMISGKKFNEKLIPSRHSSVITKMLKSTLAAFS
jgi:hypothetical protein